ncbi:uncharacterized protein LOC110975426 [Acanthaster planci]|uniref:Uncharacterized protein LOC110975426 n=1 Tax=Acanthaster planci TaxID=133434 RepID=A0A8B7XTQ8_ACAPL|nr:uncharacterized protein LOC110975426 [Acanthaster planci]
MCLTTPHVNTRTDSGMMRSETFSSIRWSNMLLLLVVFVSAHSVNATTQHACIGDRLARFPGCCRGQYARILTNKEKEEWSLEKGIRIFNRVHGTKQRQQYYTCVPCTQCGDGIKVDHQCRRTTDTVCSPTNECTHPAWHFDFGTKSCRPPIPQPAKHTSVAPYATTAQTPKRKQPEGSYETQIPEDEIDVTANTSTLWSQEQIQTIVIIVVVVVTVLLLLLIGMMVLVIRMKGQVKKFVPSPYSSQNTSNSSVNV